ncbi:helix-turn-helix domain-containing protein [Sneathiella sp. HT1-7]|uniref:helix-turn-helix domain-containing protein n=1 Tax=Sneathiella sp. HT1-7 TaxID=2887192 RepID=UPI001D151C1B|nr:helix-turn-helix domain-containing protein [Sneathiella sp. HT1-7]MCC3305846.1 helix-turn-helix domain-containing protein [Sneathiella sp. HT1-7]
MQPTNTQDIKYDPDQLINEQQAAEFLGYTVRALQNWRVRGGGPKFVKVSSRSIRYRRRELVAWSESLLISNTSAFSAS